MAAKSALRSAQGTKYRDALSEMLGKKEQSFAGKS
jgi:hypothetical protein